MSDSENIHETGFVVMSASEVHRIWNEFYPEIWNRIVLSARPLATNENLEVPEDLMELYVGACNEVYEIREFCPGARGGRAEWDGSDYKLTSLILRIARLESAAKADADKIASLTQDIELFRSEIELRKQAAVEDAKRAREKALEEASMAYGAHVHVALRQAPSATLLDECAVCGCNFRNPIHLQVGETKEQRISELSKPANEETK
jgi:hypothetical protein